VIVRTHGAQPAAIHSARSFAILHAAIYDAVNAIHRTHAPYLLDLPPAARSLSVEAAVDGAAHEVLLQLYPAFKAALDSQYQESLAQIPDSKGKGEGAILGQDVANFVLGHFLTPLHRGDEDDED